MASDTHPDVFQEIEHLRKERRAVILAHYYQEPDIQDLADYIGDSLQLAREAQKTDAEVIVFCGVHFMAETAKILNPDKVVLLPDLQAGCSLDESCPPQQLEIFKQKYPDHKVISYVNCSAAVKALSDLICTSANALRMVESFPPEQPLIFCPDKNLGAYVNKQTGRNMVLWPGTCFVHETFSEKKLLELKLRHPGAMVVAHPECQERLLRHAHHIGSTSSLLKYCIASDASTFIVATEPGLIHQMEKAAPHKTFLALPGTDESCACNECTYMRLNTPEKIAAALRDLQPQIHVDEATRTAALVPLQRMMDLS